MAVSDFLSRMEADKSDTHEVNSIPFNSHSILTGHYNTFFKLPSETYGNCNQVPDLGSGDTNAKGVWSR